MPLEILAPMVALGIAIAAILVKLLINAPERLLSNETVVRDVFEDDFPTIRIALPILISKDQRIAIFSLESVDRTIGLVEVMGSKHLTRMLGVDDKVKLERTSETRLELKLADFTLPSIGLDFDNREEAELAEGLVRPILILDNGG